MIRNYKFVVAAVLALSTFGTKSFCMDAFDSEDVIVGDGYTMEKTPGGDSSITMAHGTLPEMFSLIIPSRPANRAFTKALLLIAPQDIAGLLTAEGIFEREVEFLGDRFRADASPATQVVLEPYASLLQYMNQGNVVPHFGSPDFDLVMQMVSCRTSVSYFRENFEKLVGIAGTDLNYLKRILGSVFELFPADKHQRMSLVSLALDKFKDPLIAKNTFSCFKAVESHMPDKTGLPHLLSMLVKTPVMISPEAFFEAYNDPILRVGAVLRTQAYARMCLPLVAAAVPHAMALSAAGGGMGYAGMASVAVTSDVAASVAAASFAPLPESATTALESIFAVLGEEKRDEATAALLELQASGVNWSEFFPEDQAESLWDFTSVDDLIAKIRRFSSRK